MIRYLSHREIDKMQWDEAIRNAFNAMVYGYSWVLDIVSPRWCALVQDDYDMIFPLPGKKKYGIRYLAQPPFIQQLGLFSLQELRESDVYSFINSIPVFYRYVDIQLNEKNPVDLKKDSVVLRKNILLNLQQPYKELHKHYNRNTRRNLKKFDLSSYDVMRQDTVISDIILLFISGQGKKYARLRRKDYDLLERLLHKFLERNLMEVHVIRKDDYLLAGAVFLHSFGRYIFLFSAQSEEGRYIHALTGILDQFLRGHAGETMLLDFEGSDDPNLARFYQGFGGEVIHYPRIVINRLKWPLKFMKK